jgi:hypothetical protein
MSQDDVVVVVVVVLLLFAFSALSNNAELCCLNTSRGLIA